METTSDIEDFKKTSSAKQFMKQIEQAMREQSPKHIAVSRLLAGIEKIDLVKKCQDLGWSGDIGAGDHPKEKHFKVAIIHHLIEISKAENWHVGFSEGFFYIYNGSYWLALYDAEVKQMLLKASVNIGYNPLESSDSVFNEKLFQQAKFAGFFAESNYQKQSIINLQNGSLVLGDAGVTLKGFDHRDFLTHQLDFEYNKTAKNALFQQYLDRVLPDKDTQQTLQQTAGYLFVKGLKLEKVFFLFGTGANGKSVFFEILNGIVGSENISNFSLETLTDDKGYHRAMIKDKIVNYGTDIKLNNIDPAKFKTLASIEPIEARLPYKEPFMMTDYAKLIFNTNKMDSANIEQTHGFKRRLVIIPFLTTIDDLEQDPDLHKKILEDKAGVLNWIIEGAEQVIKSRKLFESEECKAFKAQFLKETDSVAMFEEQAIKENLRGNNSYCQSVTDSYRAYKVYCEESGLRNPLGRNNFTRRLEAIGFAKMKNKDGWWISKNYYQLPKITAEKSDF